ncbi:MAG: hypothetical protein BYD32DRAFT_167379 [Podila humilis]|nr:MAG: hypothetical protein BYD32DRAFT_167379 [Podila humilis]
MDKDEDEERKENNEEKQCQSNIPLWVGLRSVANALCRGKKEERKEKGGSEGEALGLGWRCVTHGRSCAQWSVVGGRWSIVGRDKEETKGWMSCVYKGKRTHSDEVVRVLCGCYWSVSAKVGNDSQLEVEVDEEKWKKRTRDEMGWSERYSSKQSQRRACGETGFFFLLARKRRQGTAGLIRAHNHERPKYMNKLDVEIARTGITQYTAKQTMIDKKKNSW